MDFRLLYSSSINWVKINTVKTSMKTPLSTSVDSNDNFTWLLSEQFVSFLCSQPTLLSEID